MLCSGAGTMAGVEMLVAGRVKPAREVILRLRSKAEGVKIHTH